MQLKLCILFIIGILIHATYQQQNICGTDPNIEYVADPSSCHSFLYCERDTENPTTVIRVHQGSCIGTDYFNSKGENGPQCQEDNSHCANNVLICPPEGEPDIMVANSEDPECRQFRPCRLPRFPIIYCSPGFVFNRNIGSCDYPENAPCSASDFYSAKDKKVPFRRNLKRKYTRFNVY